MEERDRHIQQREFEDFKSLINERFDSLNQNIDEKFKSNWNRNLLAIGVGVGMIRFDIPDSLAAGVVLACLGKAFLAVIWRG